MSDLILKKEVLDKLKKDPELFGKVASELGTTVSYGLQLLNNNDPKLTQANVLRIILEHVKDDQDNTFLEYEDLLTEAIPA
ncbi:MAG: hypothetical protein JWO92_2491 [Chitinophagaceae bacterium]|nr:hypothetical protein [Chitinophagaceae bacterium]